MDKGWRHTPRGQAWAIWGLGLLLSVAAAGWAHLDWRARVQDRLQADSAEVVSRIEDRLRLYEDGLRSARGAIAAAGGSNVHRRAFEAYVGSRDMVTEFPGARGIGFIRRVPADEVAAFETVARAEGPGDFRVRQLDPHQGERFVIHYIYPAQDNLGATGLDIASEPLRRDTAVNAARLGRAQLTAPITLVQAGGQVRRGLVLMLPVYRADPGIQPETRWSETIGWTYSPLVIDEMLAQLGPRAHEVAIDLTDGVDAQPFFERPGSGTVVDGFLHTVVLPVHGRTWTVRIRATSALIDGVAGAAPLAVFAYGLLLVSAFTVAIHLWLLGQREPAPGAPRPLPASGVGRTPRRADSYLRSALFRRSLLLGVGLLALWAFVSYRLELDQAMQAQQRVLDEGARGYAHASQAQQAFRRRTLLFITSTPPVGGLLRARENGGIDPTDRSTSAQWESRLQQIFIGFLEATPDTFMARLVALEDNGHELVRVQRGDNGVQVVPAPMLEAHDSLRDLPDARHLGPGQVHIADISLHREGGMLVVPHRPTIRYVTPVFDDRGQAVALVVIHVDRNSAMQQFPTRPPPGVRVLATNAAGDYVYHPDRTREFGTELGRAWRWQDDHERVAPFHEGGAARWRDPATGLMLVGMAEMRANADTDTGLLRFYLLRPQRDVQAMAWSALLARAPLALAAVLAGQVVLYLYWLSMRRRDEVQRQRLRLAAIVEQTNDAIVGLDNDGAITSWNRGAQVLFGFGADEAVGRTLESLVVPTDDDGAQVHTDTVQGAGDTPHMERWLQTRDGRRVEVSITLSPIHAPDGTAMGAAAIVRDITDERAAQREVILLNESLEEQVRERTASLSHERHRLENIIRGTNAGTWEWNVQTGERRYNERWAAMLGHGLAEVNAMGPTIWHELVHPEDKDRSSNELRRHFAGDIEQYECELRMRHRDGHWVWILDRGRVNSWTDGGEPLWMYGTHRDITAAKEAQQRLAASEALLNRTGRVAGVGGWQFDLKTWTVVWTPQMYALHEVSPDVPMEPAMPLQFYEGEARRTVLQALRLARKEGEPFDFEVPFVTATGQRRRVRLVGEPIYDETMTVSQIVGALQDVTDRHLMEAELLRINALQHSILEHMPCAISAFDADLRLVAWNTEFVNLLDLQELFARGVPTFEDIIRFNALRGEYGPGDVEAHIARTVELARNPVPHRFDRVRPDGVPIEVRGTPMPDGGFVTTYMDMSERKRAEQNVARSEALLRGAIDTVDEAFVIYDADDRLLLCNDKYRQLYAMVVDVLVPGTSFEDIIRASHVRGQLLDMDGLGEGVDWVDRRLALHRAGNSTFVQRLRGGRVVRMLENRMPDGHTVGFCIDITDLVNATDAAEAASRAKGEFLANMSHEIRTPLHAIIGLSHLLADTPLTARQQQLLAKSQMASQSLLGIVNDVLDMAKIEAGALTLEDAAFSPVALLAELDAVFRQQAEAKGLGLVIAVDNTLPAQVRGDVLRLRQVITNLLGNALKFTAEGEIRVGLRPLAITPDEVRLQGEVVDSGEGISPEVQARLFQAFSQADASTSRRHGGTGLGLSIVRRLVELMGGTIHVESEPGRGSRFWFEVSLRPATALPVPGGALEVLVVDDVAGERQALVDMARAFGWRTEACDSAESMLAWVEHRVANGQPLPDAMLVDWQLQDERGHGMDGLQALAALAERFGLARLPAALMVSASERERVAREDRLRLADDILTKPVNASVLFNAVHQGVVARHGHSGRVLQAQRAPQPQDGQRLGGTRVLVVDDSEINQEIAMHMLMREGAQVYLAGNGREALAVLRDDPARFDLVLMDVQMPELDGLQATRALRDDAALRHLPVIALTAGALAEERRRAMDAGMDRFLTKPLDPEQLLATAIELLDEHGVERRAMPVVAVAASAPGAGWPEIDGIDTEQAARRLGQDQGLLRRSLRRLFDEFGALADEDLPTALSDVERERLAARLHKLRGGAGLIAADALHRRAGTLENALRDGAAPGALAEPWQAMQAALRRLMLAAGAWLALGEPAPLAEPDQPPADDQALAQLRALLDQHDLEALSHFEAQRAALQRRLGTPRLGELAERIEALDFEAAAALLAAELDNRSPL
ncbi:MAG: PAS-domain containing protein [Hydrogenophaga sp.]|nr:PAS-domain containing protein [Hydrogenophaga sp.]